MLRMEAESMEIQNIPSQLLLSGLKSVLHNCRGFPLRSSEHLQLEISGWYQLDANKFTTTSYNWTVCVSVQTQYSHLFDYRPLVEM